MDLRHLRIGDCYECQPSNSPKQAHGHMMWDDFHPQPSWHLPSSPCFESFLNISMIFNAHVGSSMAILFEILTFVWSKPPKTSKLWIFPTCQRGRIGTTQASLLHLRPASNPKTFQVLGRLPGVWQLSWLKTRRSRLYRGYIYIIQ